MHERYALNTGVCRTLLLNASLLCIYMGSCDPTFPPFSPQFYWKESYFKKFQQQQLYWYGRIHKHASECITFFHCSVSDAIYKRKLKFLTDLHSRTTALGKHYMQTV